MSSLAPLPLTVIILVHQPDERFSQCLESVKDAAEIIVVDNTTGDALKRLGSEREFKVISHPQPIEDFSAVRNEALLQAQHEWVLFLDSDEVLDRSTIESLRQAMNTADGLTVIRQDVFHGQPLRYGEAKMRLLRLGKKAQFLFERPVHEVGKVTGVVKNSELKVLHYSHHSITEFLTTVMRYAKVEAEYRKQQGQRFSLVQLLIFPVAKAGYNLFWRLGVLDGWRGVVYAVMMSLHSSFVRIFMYEELP